MSERKLVMELEVKANATAARKAIKDVGDEAEKSGRKVKSFASQFKAEVAEMDRAAVAKARAAGRLALHGPASKSDGSEESWGTPVGWAGSSAASTGGSGGGGGGPPGGPGSKSSPGGGAFAGLRGMGFGQLARGLGAYGALHLAGNTAGAMANDPTLTLNQAFGSAIEGVAGYIPGGQTLFDAHGGALGLSSKASKKSAADMVSAIAESGQKNAAYQQIRDAGESQLADLGRGARAAKADYLSASRFQSELASVGNKGQFVTEDVLGVSTSQTGSLRLEKMKSEAALTEAANAAGEARRAVSEQQAKRDAAANAVRMQSAIAGGYEQTAQMAEDARKNKGVAGFGTSPQQNERIDQQASQATANAAQAGVELAKREMELAKQNADLQKEIENSKQRQIELGKAQLAAAQAEINIAKDQLSIIRNKQSVLEAGAIQGATEDDATKQARLDAVKRAKSQGFGSLTDEEKQLLQGGALTQNFYKEQATAFGKNDALTVATQQELGLGTLDQTKADGDKLAADINGKMAEAATSSAKVVADAFAENLKLMTEAIKTAIADAVRAAQGELVNQKANQNTIQGAQP